MLILTRKPGESLYIGDDIKISIVELKGHQIRIGIEAPKHCKVYREEIYLAILEENKNAAAFNPQDMGLPDIQTTHPASVKTHSLTGASVKKEHGTARDLNFVVRRKRSGKTDE